ncbi:MAG: hypothetical protein LC798_12640 [Chloroflexi bacterium]|nr:hypothetical protein [Chloroflexota bacterium]
MPESRLTVVVDDHDLGDLLREIFSATHRVSTLPPVNSVNAMADEEPSLLIIGPLAVRPGSTLSETEVIALARADSRLRDVPIVVLTTDMEGILADSHELSEYRDVHVVGMPFEVDVLQGVVKTAQGAQRSNGQGAAAGDAVQRPWAILADLDVSMARLPRVCRHGYDVAGHDEASSCSQCW